MPLDLFPKNLGNAIFAELCRSLPPPADDSPEARDERDTIAMTHLAALRPGDTEEAMLAVRIVAAEAHARDSLRAAGMVREDPRQMMRCRNQAATMMREADRARKELRLRQIARARAQALSQALSHVLPEVPGTTAQATTAPAGVDPAPAAGPPPEVLKQAEAFALQFPRAAIRLRRREDPSQVLATALQPADRPDPAVVQAVIHANSPVLGTLDRLDGLDILAA